MHPVLKAALVLFPFLFAGAGFYSGYALANASNTAIIILILLSIPVCAILKFRFGFSYHPGSVQELLALGWIALFASLAGHSLPIQNDWMFVPGLILVGWLLADACHDVLNYANAAPP